MVGMSTSAHIALNAHLLSGAASYRSAGIHGYLYNSLAQLPAADPDLSYTIFVGEGKPPEQPGWQVRRSRLPTGSPMLRIVWEQFFAPIQLARLRPDLFHGMAFALPVAWVGPSVVTIFDLSFLRYPERLSASRRLYLRLVTRLSARRARRVIAISESGKAEISELLGIPTGRIDVAVPGVEPEFKPLPPVEIAAFRQRQQLPDRFILYLGTIEPRKNLDTLLHAYARLPQRKQVKLVLAGGIGWLANPILKLIEQLDLRQDVIVPGYVPGDLLPMWYNAAELFVYPSLYEGFGLPLLEAMACGVPVMASNTTSLPEAVGTAGILLPPMDREVWVDRLGSLLDNPAEQISLSGRGRQRAEEFTWKRTAQQIVKSYHRALNPGGLV
jgi:glycosyltransferase involved in cell wall biosynthesis